MPPGTTYRSWQVTSWEASEKQKIGWLDEACQEGMKWTSNQRGVSNTTEYRKALEILSGQASNDDLLSYPSQVSGKRLKTNVRVAISGLANVRPIWGWHASAAYSKYANMMNKTARALYLEGNWDRSIKSWLAWAAATCTGWMRPVYSRDQAGRGHGSIKLMTYGMPSVLPVQVPSDGNFQEAYAMVLLDEVPIYMAHSKWPQYQDRLKPTASKYWYASEIRSAAKQNSWRKVSSLFMRRESSEMADLYCPIRWATIIDNSLNDTGKVIPMGESGTSWYYEVPFLGMEIMTGKGFNGNTTYRKANENDARMYPRRRLLIASEDVELYDGPTFNWHPDSDLIPLSLDKWPWEPAGFSMIHDGWSLQRALDMIDRGMHQKISAELNMPLAYDINAVNKQEAEEVDPFESHGRYGYDGDRVEGTPFKTIVPPDVYKVTPETLAVRKEFEEELDYQTQTRDMIELAKARALGKSMDQDEALISANGPVVKDMCREMEMSLCQVGKQVGYLILQYENTARLMGLVGADGVTPEVFDYNPASIVPSHLPDETIHDANENMLPSKYNDMQRAKWFADNVPFYLMPHTAHEITQMAFRLLLLQGKQRGLPISDATVMQSMEIPNVKEPEAGNSEQEQYFEEMKEKVIKAAELSKLVQAEQIDQGILGMMQGGKGSTPQGGRPASNKQAPHQETRAGGRPVVSTSE